jgi:glucose/arabinose dehydrogenase
MSFRTTAQFILATALLGALPASAQVTYGKKPALPAPFATPSADKSPEAVKPPTGFMPTVPAGFHVNIFASGFKRPRLLAIAPNGDIFLAETGADQVVVLRDPQHSGSSPQAEVFAANLVRPFGIAFHDDYVYIGNMTSVVRFHYDQKTSKRLGEGEKIMTLPGGGHDTRNLAFSKDGSKLYVAVGSSSNIGIEKDNRRGAISVCDPDGKNPRLYATGLRNPVGIMLEPVTGQLWTTVNERDEMGDNLPPDFLTSVQDGGFYGWPYSYIGSNVDPRVKLQQPDLVAKAIIPDVLLGAHVAPLQFTFYTGKQFPANYQGGAFVAEHGSWNRARRSGYQVAFVGFKNGKASAGPVPFLTGFVPDPKGENVSGRPVGIAMAPDGALLVVDDGTGLIYRITYGK